MRKPERGGANTSRVESIFQQSTRRERFRTSSFHTCPKVTTAGEHTRLPHFLAPSMSQQPHLAKSPQSGLLRIGIVSDASNMAAEGKPVSVTGFSPGPSQTMPTLISRSRPYHHSMQCHHPPTLTLPAWQQLEQMHLERRLTPLRKLLRQEASQPMTAPRRRWRTRCQPTRWLLPQ